MATTINVTVRVEIPRVPNFLIAPDQPGGKISIADVSDEGLVQLSETWATELARRAAEIRKSREEDADARG